MIAGFVCVCVCFREGGEDVAVRATLRVCVHACVFVDASVKYESKER